MKKKYESIEEIQGAYRQGEFTIEDFIKETIKNIKASDPEMKNWAYMDGVSALEQGRALDFKLKSGEQLGLLGGIPMAIPDHIAVKGMKLGAGSKILGDFISPYDAKVVEDLKEAGAIILGKTSLDEFGIYERCDEPFCGSVGIIGDGLLPVGLGSSPCGGIQISSALYGLVGFKVTQGLVSKSGLVSYASSMDQLGTMARSVEDCSRLLKVILGKNSPSHRKAVFENINHGAHIKESLIGKKIALPKGVFHEGDSGLQLALKEIRTILENKGCIVEEVAMNLFKDELLKAHEILSSVEAATSLSRFQGIAYGDRKETYKDWKDLIIGSRTQGFGHMVKEKIIFGNYMLEAKNKKFLDWANHMREQTRMEFNQIFTTYDGIMTPTIPVLSSDSKDILDGTLKYLEIYALAANIAGIPAINLHFRKKGLEKNIGIQFLGDYFKEDFLLNIGFLVEGILEDNLGKMKAGGK